MKNKNISDLAQTLSQVKSEAEMLDFLKGLLTLGELEEIARRLQIVKLLKEGVSQREIAERLKVGIATVTRGSKEIKQGRFKNI
jgi:TrpR family trp operon transcriptional repressor